MSGFEVIPAVDIRGGRCVRLYKGRPEDETIFGDDPVSAAQFWESQGASILHIVDLDGTFGGKPVNDIVIKKIIETVKIPVQVGGGIRTSEAAAGYSEAGAARVVIGTVAFEDRRLLEKLVGALRDRLVVGVDAREGFIAVRGWKSSTDIPVTDAVRSLKTLGVRRIVYTEVDRDGTLEGPDISGIESLAAAEISGSAMKMIASGGVRSTEDISRLAALQSLGVEGVIVGMALYKNSFTLQEAKKSAVIRGES